MTTRGHRIKSARVQGRAFHEAANRQPQSHQRAMRANGLRGIVGTRGSEAARACAERDHGQPWRKQTLISGNRGEQKTHWDRANGPPEAGRRIIHADIECFPAHDFPAAIFWHASENRASTSLSGLSITARRAIMRRSQSNGTACCCLRKTSRNRRFARFRRTALPMAEVDAITHTRAVDEGREAVSFAELAESVSAGFASRRFHHSVNARHSSRWPCSRTARMSPGRRRCWSARKRIQKEVELTD